MKELLLVMLLSNGADLVTSQMAFHRGAYEANPLVVSEKPVPFLVQGISFSVAEYFFLKRLSKKHPKWAKTLAMIQIGGSTAASVNNGIVYSRCGRQIC